MSFDLCFGTMKRVWKKSRELGLPWPVARRAAEAELDTIAGDDLGDGGRAA